MEVGWISKQRSENLVIVFNMGQPFFHSHTREKDTKMKRTCKRMKKAEPNELFDSLILCVLLLLILLWIVYSCEGFIIHTILGLIVLSCEQSVSVSVLKW
jgi:hypothetical protein